jgi:hypothetical protein
MKRTNLQIQKSKQQPNTVWNKMIFNNTPVPQPQNIHPKCDLPTAKMSSEIRLNNESVFLHGIVCPARDWLT